MSYIGTIFLHGVAHLMALVAPAFTGEEAVLAHVKVEALQTTVSVIILSLSVTKGDQRDPVST